MWYHDSNLYRNFNEYDEIPKFEDKVTKPDTSVNSMEDLIWVLNTMTFWDYTGEIPRDVFMYAYNTKNLKITVDMPEYFSLFRILKMISKKRFDEALKNDYIFETFKFLVDLTLANLILKYAHEIERFWSKDICTFAAKNGRLDCLKYAHENGYPWEEDVCHEAAKYGHLDCLKYAHEKGCSLDRYVCHEAAKYGHLDCLKYAHENGCPWDEYVCTYAAWLGYLDCLIYAHENGCPWNKWVSTRAAQFGQFECFKYALEHECPWEKETCLRVAKTAEIRNYISSQN